MRVSLCMIVKDEEAHLPACLASVADLVHEIVVVDTGSTDATRHIAAQWGARVFDFPWIDDFAAARNESLRYATGDWVFWLDADDRLDAENRDKLGHLFARLPDALLGFSMHCLSDPIAGSHGEMVSVDHVRLFRRHPQLRWRYRVHEQIVPSLVELGGCVLATDIVIHHVGYRSADAYQRKDERNRRLLERELQDRPDDPYILFKLGWNYHCQGRIAEALPLLYRSVERIDPRDAIVRKLVGLIMRSHHLLGDRGAALRVAEQARVWYGSDRPLMAEVRFQEGLIRFELGDLAGAEAVLTQLLNSLLHGQVLSQTPEVPIHRTRINLAAVYRRQNRLVEAEAQLRAALAERPDFPIGWQALADLLAAQGRRLEAAHACRQLLALEPTNEYARRCLEWASGGEQPS